MSTVGDFCGSVALTVPSLCHQRAPRHPWMHLTRTHGGGHPLTMSRFPSVVMTSHLTLVHILSDDNTRQGISFVHTAVHSNPRLLRRLWPCSMLTVTST